MSTLAALWAARSPRERAAIAITANVLAAILIVALIWLPLERARTRLAAELPGLRASVGQMRLEADEVKRLRTLPAREAPLAPTALIASGTFTQGLPGAATSALDTRRIRLTVADASWNAVIAWVERTQGAHGLAVESAIIEALPVAGRVRAEIVVARP